MPYFVKCLWDIENDNRVVPLGTHLYIYLFFVDSVYLFYDCMPMSVYKLIIGDYTLPFDYF